MTILDFDSPTQVFTEILAFSLYTQEFIVGEEENYHGGYEGLDDIKWLFIENMDEEEEYNLNLLFGVEDS